MDKVVFDKLRTEQKLDVGRAVNAMRTYFAAMEHVAVSKQEYETLLIKLRASGISVRDIAALLDRNRNHIARHTAEYVDPKNTRVRQAAQRRGRQMRRRRRTAA